MCVEHGGIRILGPAEATLDDVAAGGVHTSDHGAAAHDDLAGGDLRLSASSVDNVVGEDAILDHILGGLHLVGIDVAAGLHALGAVDGRLKPFLAVGLGRSQCLLTLGDDGIELHVEGIALSGGGNGGL